VFITKYKIMTEKFESYLAPTGRIIMGAFFVLAGVGKIMDISGTANYIESVGLPNSVILVVLAIIIEVGLGGALLIGFKPRIAAFALSFFTLFLTFTFHGPQLWTTDPTGTVQVMFMKNLVIFGSLLFMAAHAGRFATGKIESIVDSKHQPVPTL
jgi:putative oxidoreductase